MNNIFTLKNFILLAGIGQIVLVIGSLWIPKVLKWRQQLTALNPLLQQVFWTYAGYILATNLGMGLVSVLMPEVLIDGSMLALVVTGYIAIYWVARLVIQFTYFDTSHAPVGQIYKLAEGLLLTLFLFLAAVYGYAVYLNMSLAR